MTAAVRGGARAPDDAPAARGLREAAIYVGSNFLARGLAFLLVPLFARALSPEEYGAWGLALAVGNFASLVLLFGLYVPVSRLYFTEEGERRAGAYGAVIVLQLVGGAAGALLLDAAVARLPWDASAVAAARIAVWSAWLTNFSLVPLTLLRVRGRVTAFAAVSAAGALVSLVAPLAAVQWGPATAVRAMEGQVWGAAAMAAAYLALARGHVRAPLAWGALASLLAHGLQFIPQSLSTWVLNLSDRVVLEGLVGLDQLGVYTAGYALGMAVMLFCEGVGNAWFTYFLRQGTAPGGQAGIVRASTGFVAAGAAAAMVGGVFGPVVVAWILPERYAAAAPVVSWVSLAYAAWAPYLIFVYSVMSVERLTVLPVLNYLPAALNVALNLWWVPRWGIEGAAAATFVSVVVLAVVDGLLAARVRAIPHEYGRWSALLAATATAVAAGRLLDTAGAPGFAARVLLAGAWAALAAVGPLRAECRVALGRVRIFLGYHHARR